MRELGQACLLDLHLWATRADKAAVNWGTFRGIIGCQGWQGCAKETRGPDDTMRKAWPA